MRLRLIYLFLILTVRLTSFAAESANGSLTGTVLDEAGDPVHATVAAFQLTVQGGVVTPMRRCVTETGTDGRFNCDRLIEGRYILVINMPNLPLQTASKLRGQSEISILPRFAIYPQVYGEPLTDLLHIAAEGREWANVIIRDDSLHTVRVQAPPSGEGRRLQAYWQADGFAIPIFTAGAALGQISGGDLAITRMPAGNYLFVDSWHSNGQEHDASGFASVGDFSQNRVVLNEQKKYDVSGKVIFTSRPRLPSTGAGSNLGTVVILNSVQREIPRRYISVPDHNGKFTFRGIEGGEYEIFAGESSKVYISHLFAGQHEEQSTTIEIDENLADLPLRLVMAPASASISGSLELDGTEDNPGVLIHSLDSGFNEVIAARKDGAFSANGLAPGDYLVYGWGDIDEVPYEESIFLTLYKNDALAIELDAGSQFAGLDIECEDTNY